jgi:type I site-specific restriction-modification system R (restriction) subunit
LFADLGWQTVSALNESSGPNDTLSRETKSDVVLSTRLRSSLEKLNSNASADEIAIAIDELTRDRSAMSLEAANREIYSLLKEGVKVSRPDHENGGQKIERLRVIDWEQPLNNDFLLVSQLTITGSLYTCRPDLIGFVNGLPLVVIELKKPGVAARVAFDENLTHYKKEIPALFWFNALMIASNGTDSRVGSLTADWERYFEWKRIEREDEPRRVSMEVMLRGTCDKTRLLDLLENFTLYSELKAGLAKIVGQNHQFLGVNNAITSMLTARAAGHGRGGVFWQTQGSGKSFSMVFFAQKVLRKLTGNWTFVVITDRVELDDQIAKTFKAAGAVSEAESKECHASSGAKLRELLRGNHRYVFTLIHKFQPERSRAETPSSPALLPKGEGGEESHYRGGLQFSGLIERARELREIQTPAEAVAWELLRDRRCAGLKFRRQHQIGNYIADFFCAEHGLVVELDGGVHELEAVEKKDATRDKTLASLGFSVLRFQNEMILKHPEEFLDRIIAAIDLPSTSGRGAEGEGQPSQMEVLSDRADIIVMVDEAHRSQYDTLAMNMRAALPNAMFLAFTGTPLIAGEERTKEVFGDYVSIYDFQQSVEDGATVPLFYENRAPELQLINPDLNDDIYNAIEAADLNPDQEAKLEKELNRQYHLITRDERLEVIAQDIVSHFLGRGFQGKAMVVSIDKATALKMHDKVRNYWAVEKQRVTAELADYGLTIGRRDELQARLKVLETTDMAVIVSPAQNEIAHMSKLGLDIEPHRKRMNEEELDEKFKDTADPLRLVFVCAMWLTGFDAPSCSTVYLDKPMRNHTLMQTIARANRVFADKHSGLIVDYANVFASLEKALAIYGAGKDGHNPVKDKKQLVAELREAVNAADKFCRTKGVVLNDIMSLPHGNLERLNWLAFSVDALISPDHVRQEYLGRYRLIDTLYKAVKPDPAAVEFAQTVACLALLASEINRRLNPNPPDISAVMADINAVLDESISGATIPNLPGLLLDLSKIDFQSLANRFRQSKTKNTDLEMLKAAIKAHLEKLIQLNRTRADFQEKFEKLIESYNNGSRNIEAVYNELISLSLTLNDEQQRHIRENITEEELVIFDILMRPAPELSTAERVEVKKVAKELLTKLKQLLVLNWRQKSSARSQLKLAIEDVLDTGLPRAFTPELYQQKCSALFEHVYESYPERNVSVYTS